MFQRSTKGASLAASCSTPCSRNNLSGRPFECIDSKAWNERSPTPAIPRFTHEKVMLYSSTCVPARTWQSPIGNAPPFDSCGHPPPASYGSARQRRRTPHKKPPPLSKKRSQLSHTLWQSHTLCCCALPLFCRTWPIYCYILSPPPPSHDTPSCSAHTGSTRARDSRGSSLRWRRPRQNNPPLKPHTPTGSPPVPAPFPLSWVLSFPHAVPRRKRPTIPEWGVPYHLPSSVPSPSRQD